MLLPFLPVSPMSYFTRISAVGRMDIRRGSLVREIRTFGEGFVLKVPFRRDQQRRFHRLNHEHLIGGQSA